MSMFTLAISCLTTSNLSWFIDLTFTGTRSLCNIALKASDFTSITCHIHNGVLFLLWLCLFILSGVISSLFSSSISGTYWPGEFIFQCHSFLPFHTVHGVVKARKLKWFAIPFSSGPHSVRTLCHDPSILGGSTGLISFRMDWRLSRVFSNTTVQTHQFFGTQPFSVQLSYPYMTTGKTIALTKHTLVSKVMSLLLNILSRLVILCMFSKSLIQSSLEGRGCVSSLLLNLRPNCGGGNEDSSCKKSHAGLLPSGPLTLQQATADPRLCWRLLATHGHVRVRNQYRLPIFSGFPYGTWSSFTSLLFGS